jgi:hypothetical protein
LTWPWAPAIVTTSERHHRDRRAQQFHLDELIRNTLRERHDPREVITDPHAPYYGAELNERTLVPAADARLAETRFDDWLNQSTIGNN